MIEVDPEPASVGRKSCELLTGGNAFLKISKVIKSVFKIFINAFFVKQLFLGSVAQGREKIVASDLCLGFGVDCRAISKFNSL